ncbi:transposase [Streptomyces sp. NPDC058682]|uniref:transposase n=1 Tax=Streptomyces sp. NPDC058682 TaxID=3346596 RepID=UPI0036565F72
MIDAIAFKYRTGTPWMGLPECFGSWKDAHGRLRMWAIDGTWQRVFVALPARGDVEASLRSCQGATGRRPGPPDVPWRWHPRRRTGPGPGRPPRSPAVSPARLLGWLLPGRGAGRLGDGSRCRPGRFRQRVDQVQDRAPADADAEHLGHAGAGPAGQCRSDVGRRRAKPFRPLALVTRQPRNLLD